MTNDPSSASEDTPLPPPTGAPVQLPPPPKKPLYKKWWFWVLVAFGLLLLVSFWGSGSESTDSDEEADSAQTTEVVEETVEEEVVVETPTEQEATAEGTTAEETAVEETAEETPSEEIVEEEPVAEATVDEEAESASSVSPAFESRARGDMADLVKDLDDMAIAATEGGIFRLLGNSVELSFNVGQLQSLTPPEEIAADWDKALNRLEKRVDAISDAIGGEASTQQLLERIGSAAKAVVRLSEVVDQLDN